MKPEAKFVQRIAALFGEPTGDLANVVIEYENALRGHSAATLEAAADDIRRTRKYRSWPTVAECLEAAAAAKKRGSYASAGLEPIADFDSWWHERMMMIKHADSEAQIERAIKEIEPYAAARWIASHRLGDAMALASDRRDQWSKGIAEHTSRRMTGEAE